MTSSNAPRRLNNKPRHVRPCSGTLVVAVVMSVVWNYFKVSMLNSKIAVCNECKAEVSRGAARTASFNTSNLISHLKNHPEIHATFIQQNNEKKHQVTPRKSTQVTFQETVFKKEKSCHIFSINSKLCMMLPEISFGVKHGRIYR